MHKIPILILLFFLFHPMISFGQEEDWQIKRKKRQEYSNTLDSLFLQNRYEQIIEICNHSDAPYSSIHTYNLIATYYFIGDSLKSWELLNKEIARILSRSDVDAYSLDRLFETEVTSYKKFLIESSVKEYVLEKIDSVYMTEPVSDKENGLELLHLLIEDQWIRKISSMYDKLNPDRKYPLPPYIDSLQAIQLQRDHSTKVFNFYKKQNKVFSKAEVGRIYYWQLMLIFHEWDLERRKFYHELIIKAVENDVLEMKDRANFEAGTEYIILGVDEFFKQRTELEEKYKKKYSLPDTYRIRLM